MGSSSPPDCSCRGETQDKRPKTARRSPPCPPELLFLTSARPTLRTSRRQRSTDTSCSTSRRRRVFVVESVGDRDSSYDDYLNDLQKGGDGECRYGLYDYEYEHQCQGTTESSKKQKLFLMAWCPDSAKIKKKMLYSTTFDALKKSLVGVH